MPEGEDYEKFEEITERLSRKYQSPRIRPHVTLVGCFTGDIEDFIHKIEALAEQTRSFFVGLSGLDTRDEFFRSVFILADKSTALLNAYEEACKAFDLPADKASYLPHMSLIYGDFDAVTKEEIKRSVQIPQPGFTAQSLCCVVNNERDKTWPELARFYLK